MESAMHERLVFLIGAPRSGTTLTARMLGAHPAVLAPPEPHLMPPLAHLGFDERVEQAPYDPVITQIGLREFVTGLPAGEQDYLDGLRRFTDHLYERALAPSGRRIYLDKTPAYALVLDFLAKLYPGAKYIVLTRHPMAIWSSYVDSFFAGDAAAAHARNPILERYVPAIARFLRERPVPLVHVRYEELVRNPEKHLREICAFMGVEFTPTMIQYGDAERLARPATAGLGDPVMVDRQKRPMTESVGKWAAALAADPVRLRQSREIAARLTDEDLATWGLAGAELRRSLAEIAPAAAGPSRAQLSRYALERRLLVALRRNIHTNALGRLVRRVRTLCDVLLR
jgi:hypothetical protein